ncbi:MAG: c(7)-type cytochrome triheme domain-containing protein [Burkholderiales bacterium]
MRKIKLASLDGMRLRRALQLVLFLCAGLLAACGSPPTGSQPSVLAMIFDIPPPGQDPGHAPVVHTPRRIRFVDTSIAEPSKEYVEMIKALEKASPPPNWNEIFKSLPKDKKNNIDWMAALAQNLIKPRPGIDEKTPESKTSKAEVLLSTSGNPSRYVVFQHATHTQWLTCTNCHPAIFARDGGADKITMDDIDAGKFCGVCHDKVALAPPAGCKGCHKPRPKPEEKKS